MMMDTQTHALQLDRDEATLLRMAMLEMLYRHDDDERDGNGGWLDHWEYATGKAIVRQLGMMER